MNSQEHWLLSFNQYQYAIVLKGVIPCMLETLLRMFLLAATFIITKIFLPCYENFIIQNLEPYGTIMSIYNADIQVDNLAN